MATLINGLGGTSGFGENVLPANDDGSSAAIDITSVFESGINFFGTTYTSLFVNNNGNISFGSAIRDFNPNGLSDTSGVPIIAAFWSDVDTRAGALTPSAGGNSTGSNLVYWDLDPAGNTFTATWDDVGEFSNGTVPNAFQLQLTDLGGGDFSIQYIYEAIGWTRGAGAGYSARDGVNFFEFPASRNDTALPDLVTSSNIGDEGVFEFGVADGIPSSQAPLIVTNSAVNVLENTTLVVDIQATDNTNSEGNGLTYSLSGGEDQSLFTVNAATGVLSFISAPDFEQPLDVGNDNGYGVEVTVTDAGGLSTAQLFNITVTDIIAPMIVTNGTVNVPENTTLVVDIEATGDNSSEGNGLTYSLSGGEDQGLFTIDVTTGELSFISAPDFEQPLDVGNDNGYGVEVTVTDAGGLSTAQLFNITVTDVNEDPINAPTPFDDILSGTAGDDTILALAGNDVVRGLGGDDRLFGQAGNDRLLGGVGNDVLNGGADSDRLFGQVGNDALIGGTGNDVLIGGADNDRLFGQAGNDALIGGTGNDVLNGGADSDRLFGQAGSDRLDGGTGNDRLDGGTGNDIITTGAGRDLIVIRQNDGFDRVTDFQNNQDRIDLVGIRFGQLTIRQRQDDVLIKLGTTNLLLLENTNAAAINQADFV